MADTKTQAMNEAKDAALNSVSFVISATKAQSMELKKASLLAARNVVSVRKNLITLVNTFNSYKNIITQIQDVLGKKGEPSSKLSRIGGILQSGGDAYKAKEAEQEDKPKALELVKGIGKDMTTAAGSALALAIPFLLSPEMREMLFSFFDGFLKGLGLTDEGLSRLKIGLAVAGGILVTYFAVKTIASVYSAFQQMQKLAEVLGLAGNAVNAEKTKQDLDKKKMADASKDAKKDIKASKKELKKGQKLGKTSFLKKWKVLSKVVGPKLVRLGTNFLKAIPVVGTLLGIGLVLYDIFDIGKDVYEMFTGSGDDVAEDQDTEQEDAAPIAITGEPTGEPPPAAAESKAPTSNTAPQEPPAASVPSPKEAEPAPSSSTAGSEIKESSIKVERADTDLAQTAGGISVIAVDNSTTIISNQKTPIQSSPAFYSVTVGAY
jgi:hypothetical protein